MIISIVDTLLTMEEDTRSDDDPSADLAVVYRCHASSEIRYTSGHHFLTQALRFRMDNVSALNNIAVSSTSNETASRIEGSS